MKKILLSLIAVMATLSINAQVVAVYENGSLSAAYANSSTKTVKVVAEEAPDYVEIGGVKWATKNLGATTVAGNPATCYGNYYAWGETEPRYTSITISGDGNSATFGGWSSSHSSGYSSSDKPSYEDGDLDAAHDAATQNWGSNWRMPTGAEFQALAKACTGSTESQSISSISTSTPTGGVYWLPSDQTYLSEYTGVAGVLFVDATDTSKRVFFPAAGRCNNTDFIEGGEASRYWSSYISNYDNAFRLLANSTTLQPSIANSRCLGYTIRPVLNDEANLLPGKFSVSATKQVQFSKGNLYFNHCDNNYAGEFHFEANQTDYPTSMSSLHVGHFYWTNLTDYHADKNSYGPYYPNYEFSSQSTSDKFWCGENNKLTVDGTYGLYVLTQKEWAYLINSRANHSSLIKYGVTVGTTTNCVIIAPDNFTGTLQTSYTLAEVNAAGLVCLPPAGFRNYNYNDYGDYFWCCGSYGDYWSATPDASTSSNAYFLDFSSSVGNPSASGTRSYARAIRLVHNIDEQVVKVYENGSLSATYGNSSANKVKVVFAKEKVSSITLSKTSAKVTIGSTVTLTPTIAPSDAFIKTVTWKSSDPTVATVANGVVTGVATGTATITATAADGSGVTATCTVTVILAKGTAGVLSSAGIDGNKVQWVQLWEGGPKWAVFNVGAKSVSEYGGYYNWGKSVDKETDNAYSTSTTDIQGTTDDTAKNLWGDNWQMPTKTDYDNLIAHCDVTWTTQNGLPGRLYTGKGGYSSNSVFFPAAGFSLLGNSADYKDEYGRYWSSTPSTDKGWAYILSFDNTAQSTHQDNCLFGRSVRAILKE